MRVYLFCPSTHCFHLPKTKTIGRAPEHNWALNNPDFHPVLLELPLSNAICRELYYRMAKLQTIFVYFHPIVLHLKGLLRIPLKLFPCDKMVLGVYCPACGSLVIGCYENQNAKKKQENTLIIISLEITWPIRLRLYRNSLHRPVQI